MTCLGLKPTTCETAYMSFAPVSERCITGAFTFSIFSMGTSLPGARVSSPKSNASPGDRSNGQYRRTSYPEPDAIYVWIGAFVLTAKEKFASEVLR
jgi:hypothetical protein